MTLTFDADLCRRCGDDHDRIDPTTTPCPDDEWQALRDDGLDENELRAAAGDR